MPASAYLFGQAAPLFLSWFIPRRRERDVVVWANAITASLLASVMVTLLLPLPGALRIGAVVAQGLLQGLSGSASLVFMIQCLRRGTTLEGRAHALKRTFSIAPFLPFSDVLFRRVVCGRCVACASTTQLVPASARN